jgi:DNA-binding IclR family transcriptional regulator
MLSAERKGGDGVPGGPTVTGRVAALLAAFDTEHGALTLSELSRRTALPLTTTHRLAGELSRHGMLERDELGRYRIGLRLWEIAATAARAVDLREAALPFLQDRCASTRENVQLAVLDGREAVYLERLSRPGAVHVVTRVGSRLPVHATGVGLVLLAHAPVEVQDHVLTGELIRLTRYTVTDPRRLRRILADVRRDGYVVSARQVTLDAVSVAAPIFGPEQTVVASVSLVVPADEARPLALAPVVQASARGISRALGGPSPSSRLSG